jgi:hypothetical protein
MKGVRFIWSFRETPSTNTNTYVRNMGYVLRIGVKYGRTTFTSALSHICLQSKPGLGKNLEIIRMIGLTF